jgi:two-component system, cell cycle sensor histidine kinase and response regulator CckA
MQVIRAVEEVVGLIGLAQVPTVWLRRIAIAGGLALILALMLALAVRDPHLAALATVAGLTLLTFVFLVWSILRFASLSARLTRQTLDVLLGEDAAPAFTTDAEGRIGFQNAAARTWIGAADAAALIIALRGHFASPAAVLYRLQAKAQADGAARADVVSRAGQMRLSVHRIGPQQYLWRMEEFALGAGAAAALPDASLPILVAARDGAILSMTDAMRALAGDGARDIHALFGPTLPEFGHEVAVQGATGPFCAILADAGGDADQRRICLVPVVARLDAPDVGLDFEHLPIALARFAPDGGLRLANRLARSLLHLTQDDLPNVTRLFEGLGRSAADWLADVAAERVPAGSEVLRLHGGAGDSFVQLSLRRIIEDGRIEVLAVLNDATALKTLEAQFAQSQKMQAVGELAGGIAHDFNNLLTAISGHCDLLLLRYHTDSPEYADLVQIHQNANRAAALVGQLLAFSRKQTLTPEQLEVHEVLSDLTHLLNRLVGERVTLRVAHAPVLGQIRADKRQLEQVIMNLVVNARDAMAQGGTIRIETEAVTLRETLRRDRALVPEGKYAVIRVLDTGCGIPPDRLEKVFEPFYTTKRVGEGTGLGLSMAYGIVKQSGGFIFCDSEVGKGTVFHLYFPIHAAPAIVPVPVRPPAAQTRPRHGVVLLVEDEAPVRAFASRALRLRGFTVLEAADAEAALKLLEDGALRIDVFVTDVVMPGMDGPTWVMQALVARPDVRVIFVSGYAEECLSESQARIPNSVFLPKPYSLSQLTETVRGQMELA